MLFTLKAGTARILEITELPIVPAPGGNTEVREKFPVFPQTRKIAVSVILIMVIVVTLKEIKNGVV